MASTAGRLNGSCADALARGRVYGFLAGLLASPSASEVYAPNAAIEGLLAALPYPLDCPDGLLAGHACAEMQSEFLRLFELRITGPPCALYGGVYSGDRQATMQELLRYYRHFGLTVSGADQQDLPDSIATVLEFMQFLCMSESASQAAADAVSPRLAQRDILSRHLTVWAPRMLERVLQLSPPPFYAGVMTFMHEFCATDLAFLEH